MIRRDADCRSRIRKVDENYRGQGCSVRIGMTAWEESALYFMIRNSKSVTPSLIFIRTSSGCNFFLSTQTPLRTVLEYG